MTKILVLAALLSLLPSTASAATAVWPQGECDGTANRSYVCGLQVLTCGVEWVADVARTDGLESGLRCVTRGIVRYVVVNRLGIVLLDTGNTAGADVDFAPTDVIRGDYMEVLVTYSSPTEDKAAIAYYDAVYGQFRIVYTTSEPVFEVAMTVSPFPGTRILECDRSLEWSVSEREFRVLEDARNPTLCSYEGDD